MYWIAPIALAVSAVVTYLVLRLSGRLGLIDVPSERSSHLAPTPRGGGLGILAAISLAIALYFIFGYWTNGWRGFAGLLAGILIIGLAGFADDLWDPPVYLRLGLQVVAVTVLLIGTGPMRAIRFPVFGTLDLGFTAIPVSLVWVLSVTNIYNFMDGIDGLAAGQGVIAGGFLACIGSIAGNTTIQALGIFAAAASLGFLFFNFPPAKIFMGDVGSTTLGFTFGAMAVIGARNPVHRVDFLVVVLVLGSFLFDSTITLFRRALRRERLHESHNDHFYQAAIQIGWSHRQVTLAEYGIMVLLGASAILYYESEAAVQLGLFCLWFVVFSIVGFMLIKAMKTGAVVAGTVQEDTQLKDVQGTEEERTR